jgi:enamine deaminase RidA (YjgF/YER057c/UK114 family)
MFYVAAILYGFADCTFQSAAAAICAKSFQATGNTADAWALFRTFQAAGAAACFFVSPIFVASGESYSTQDQLLVEIIITTIVGVAALFGHWLFCTYSVGNAIDPADAAPFNHSSRAVVVDRTVYTSAMGGTTDGKLGGHTTSDEAQLACEAVTELLDSVGSGADKVIKATIYTTPDADVDAVIAEYESHFTGPNRAPQPVLSVAMVAQLPFGRRVQIDVVATL